jgi:cytoskeletal protein RodZ
MSLINDALKRANQSPRKAPVSGPLGVPVQHVETARKPAWAAMIVLGIGALAGTAIGLVWLGSRVLQPPPPPAQTVALAPATPPPAPEAPPVAKAAPAATRPEAHTPPAASEDSTSAMKVGADARSGSDTVTVPSKPATSGEENKATPVPPAPNPVVTPVAQPFEHARLPVAEVAVAPTSAKAEPKVSTTQAAEPAPTAVSPPLTEPPPPARPAVQFPELKVGGILYNSTRPTAVVNGRILAVGATVAGVRVTAIGPDSVTFELEGERKVVPLR